MIQFLLIFITTAIVSFIGSLQPGPVNMQVLGTTLRHGRKAGFMMALGGCLPELLYSALALYAAGWFTQYTDISQYASWIIILLFTAMGLSTLFNANRIPKQPATVETGKFMLTGLFMAMLNPLLFTYWFGMAALFQTYGLPIESVTEQVAFIIGTSTGAFLLLSSVAQLAEAIRSKGFFNENKRIAIFTGTIYLLIATGEGIRLLMR